MLGIIEITGWVWALFVALIVFFLALDLGVFHRQDHVVKFKEAMGWTVVWATLAVLFYVGLIDLIKRTSKAVSDLSLQYDVVISRAFISAEQFDKGSSPFLLNVRRESIPI